MSKNLNTQRLRYLILKEITNGERISSKGFNMDSDEFEKFLIGMQTDGYIDGLSSSKDRLYILDVRVTALGEKYLKENSKLAKFYQGAKEVRDWIPFLYN